MRLLLLTLTFVLFSCKKDNEPLPEQALAIHFTCDTYGRLEPCGCFTGQHGGLTRLRTWLQEKDREGRSLRFDVGGALAGVHDYDLIQYKYLLKAYSAMGYQALNLGGREAAVDVDDLLAITSQSPVPIVSASLVDPESRELLFRPYTIVEEGGRQIGVIGLIDPTACPDPGQGVAILNMPEAVDRVLPELKEKCDIIIALAFSDETGMDLLAKSYFEFDVILGGDVRQPAQSVTKTNESLIAFTTNEGRTVASLLANISGGPNPRLTDPAYSVQLLFDNIPQNKEFRALVVDYRNEIRNTKLDVDGRDGPDPHAIPGVTATSTYAGSESCKSCHQEDHKIWEGTAHAHAFETLVKRGADADPHCIKCHTVGFGEPSGYRREYGVEKRINVSCESCHGPASEHVAEMTQGKPKRFRFRPLGAADCTKCHHGEFSRPFVWDEFWPKVQHGTKK